MFRFDHLLPIPLSDQLEKGSSDIWNTSCMLDASKRYFIEAPSGKGKTTFQHILYGLRKDYTGKVFIDQEGGEAMLSNLTLDQWATIRQQQLSVVFQDLRLFLPLTAMENILLKNNLTNHLSKDRIKTMATQLEVDHLLNKKCGEMSYGQRQRIAIIRAMCQPFRFLVMDEPFAHLDSQNIQRCCTLIEENCAEQGAGYAIASLEERYYLKYDENLVI